MSPMTGNISSYKEVSIIIRKNLCRLDLHMKYIRQACIFYVNKLQMHSHTQFTVIFLNEQDPEEAMRAPHGSGIHATAQTGHQDPGPCTPLTSPRGIPMGLSR